MNRFAAIDADVAGFLGLREESHPPFALHELKAFLTREGHDEADVSAAVDRWHRSCFAEAGAGLFILHKAGRAVLDHPDFPEVRGAVSEDEAN